MPVKSRAYFFAAVARAMRQVLVDAARRRGRLKRGDGEAPLDLDDFQVAVDDFAAELRDLDEALERLAAPLPAPGARRGVPFLRWSFSRGDRRGARAGAAHRQAGLGARARVALPGAARGTGGLMSASPRSACDPERLTDIFGEAIERPPAERGAFLDAACGAAPELRAEVESLLAAYEQAGDFMDALDSERGAALLEATSERRAIPAPGRAPTGFSASWAAAAWASSIWPSAPRAGSSSAWSSS